MSNWDPEQKQQFNRSLGLTYLRVLGSLLERWGAAVAHPGDTDTGESIFGNVLLLVADTWLISTRTWPHSMTYRCRGQDSSGHITDPSTSKHTPNGLPSPQPPPDTSLDTAQPTGGSGPGSTYPWAGTSPSLQKACRTHQGADTRLKTRILHPADLGCQKRARPYPRTSCAPDVPTSRQMLASGHPVLPIQQDPMPRQEPPPSPQQP